MPAKRTVILVILLTVLTFFPALAQDREELYGIEPGWRAGPIVFAMTMEQVQGIYGDGKIYINPGGDSGVVSRVLQYEELGLEIYFKGQSMEEIHISYPYYTVKGFVKVGSGVDRVREIMGLSYIQENYQHSYQTDLPDMRMIYRGIIFEVKNNRVVRIILRRSR